MTRIAIFISGEGETLQAILDAKFQGDIDAEISLVLSNNEKAYGLSRATERNIPTAVFSNSDYPKRDEREKAIVACLEQYQIDYIVLAGYMSILSADFVQMYLGKILNIHPSLLPKYPGLDTYSKALAAGDKEHGTTVHFVTADVDGGPIVTQGRVPILENDTIISLTHRVKLKERIIYPIIIQLVTSERVIFHHDQVYFDKTLLSEFTLAK